MKQLSKLKLANISKANMPDSEMNKLYGGNYCHWGPNNQAANNYEGKCSCMCNDYGKDAVDYRFTNAASYKTNGTLVPDR